MNGQEWHVIDVDTRTRWQRFRQFLHDLRRHMTRRLGLTAPCPRCPHPYPVRYGYTQPSVAELVKGRADESARALMLERILIEHFPDWETCDCEACQKAVEEHDLVVKGA